MRYRYICSESTDPYENLALEQCLFRQAAEGTAILYLWQNDHTIVVGRNQDVYAECRAEEFIRSGGRIARRRSGGGAVYHDLGNLNFSLIGRKTDLAPDACRNLVMAALKQFGAEAEFNGRNDLVVNGRKCSGNACYEKGGVLCQHGTVLVCSDIGKMARYLTPDEGKLARNRVKSVSARVGNLSELLPEVTVEKVRDALIGAAGALPLRYREDRAFFEEQEAFFRKEAWIFGGKV